MTQEVWKKIEGFDNYSISSLGRVKRRAYKTVSSVGATIYQKEVIKRAFYNKGYQVVTLYNGEEEAKRSVHRLIAIYFIPNPLNLPQVNHKNGIRHDNRIENLEWCTNEENSRHSREVLGKDGSIKNRIKILCLNNGKEYVSTIEASNLLGIARSNIYRILKKVQDNYKGYKFIYANEAARK